VRGEAIPGKNDHREDLGKTVIARSESDVAIPLFVGHRLGLASLRSQ
jgi:hypothetical protein